MGDEEPDEFVCRCGLVVKDHHLSIACDICDQWFHVQCCGLAKEQSEKIAGSFMCKGCHAEGFMGGGADWYIEPADSKPVPLPESSSSEEESSDEDERPGDGSGTTWGRVVYDNESAFWGELRDGNEYLGAFVDSDPKARVKMVKWEDGVMLKILWEDIDFAAAQEAHEKARRIVRGEGGAEGGGGESGMLYEDADAGDGAGAEEFSDDGGAEDDDDEDLKLDLEDEGQEPGAAGGGAAGEQRKKKRKKEREGASAAKKRRKSDSAQAVKPRKEKKRKVLDQPRGDSQADTEKLRARVASKLGEALEVNKEELAKQLGGGDAAAEEGAAPAEAAALSASGLAERSREIEAALFRLHGGRAGMAYKQAARSLAHNLGDKANDKLRIKVLQREIAGSVLVKMSSAQLANPEAQKHAAEIEENKIYHSRKVDEAVKDGLAGLDFSADGMAQPVGGERGQTAAEDAEAAAPARRPPPKAAFSLTARLSKSNPTPKPAPVLASPKPAPKPVASQGPKYVPPPAYIPPPAPAASAPAARSGSGSADRGKPPPAPRGWDDVKYSEKRGRWYFRRRQGHPSTRWVTDEEMESGKAEGEPEDSAQESKGWTAMYSERKKKWYVVNLLNAKERRWVGSEGEAKRAAVEEEERRLRELGASTGPTEDLTREEASKPEEVDLTGGNDEAPAYDPSAPSALIAQAAALIAQTKQAQAPQPPMWGNVPVGQQPQPQQQPASGYYGQQQAPQQQWSPRQQYPPPQQQHYPPQQQFQPPPQQAGRGRGAIQPAWMTR